MLENLLRIYSSILHDNVLITFITKMSAYIFPMFPHKTEKILDRV
jgi:hypothetical protein